MDERTLRVLEYEKIKALLGEQAACSLGKRLAARLAPSRDPERVRRSLADTSEARRLLQTYGAPPLGGLTDIHAQAARARAGGALAPDELLQVAAAIRCARRMGEYLAEGEKEAPRLADLGERLSRHDDLEDEIHRCIDDEGNVQGDASPELSRLLNRAEVLERRVRERIEAILRREAERGLLQDPVIVQRAGRFCLPVQATQQSRFAGIIHDRSDSGATVFMEPLEAVEAGNALRETQLQIEAEVERILRALSARVGGAAEALAANLRTLGQLDFIFARGRLAARMGATEPRLVDEPRLRLTGARHPLITGDVVPVDVWLGDEFATLVITGPNTGGKTVTLKTVGLLALMAQSGLHIPAQAGSEITVWEHIHADIGDEQSIEQSLSTFSSHMGQIVRIINRVRARSRRADGDEPIRALVLLDEIGAGTDPTEGAALARAILTELHEAGCRTIATTHYNDLKVFAYATPGVENASVEFDIKTLQPTFRLSIGQAGSSNAFDIAQRLGLDRRIVRRGRDLLDETERSFEQAVSEVERKQQALQERMRETTALQGELAGLRRRYETDLEKLESRRRSALEEGFAEAEAIIREAEERARAIIAELQRQPRQSRITEEGRRELGRERERLRREREQLPATPAPAPEADAAQDPALDAVLLGDQVHVPALGRDGIVVAIPREGVASVQLGNMRTEVDIAQLRPPVDGPPQDARDLAEQMQTRKSFTVPKELDIRGMSVDEALPELEKYLDDVALARFPQVRIIHGKGTGVLRKAVHDFLRRRARVREFRYAEQREGGDGATEVFF